jgi:DNA-binding LytR/AlgR family response regulator
VRALVVDDEPVARRRLTRMLARLKPPDAVDVIGEAADGDEALERIQVLAPDVVFLDIRMPGMDGLQLARRLSDSTHVVFTTAYDEHAVQAFDAAAVDYLLKPIETARLAAAVQKVRRLQTPVPKQDLARLLAEIAERRTPPRIAARHGDAVRIFDPREISRFHAEDRYTVFRHGGREYLLDDSIVALEARLAPWAFLRVHRNELVNLDHVKAVRREDDATLVDLANGERAAVSRRHLGELKRRLGIPAR